MAARGDTVEAVLEVVRRHVSEQQFRRIVRDLLDVPGNASFREMKDGWRARWNSQSGPFLPPGARCGAPSESGRARRPDVQPRHLETIEHLLNPKNGQDGRGKRSGTRSRRPARAT